MNHDQITGNWMQFKGKVKEHWGKVRGHAIDAAIGRHDQLRGRIRQAQGTSRAESQKQLRDWERGNTDVRRGMPRPR